MSSVLLVPVDSPPDAKNRPGKYDEVVYELRGHPGQWFRVGEGRVSAASSASTVAQLRRKYGGVGEGGAVLEFRSRRDPESGSYFVFGRCVSAAGVVNDALAGVGERELVSSPR